jgi:hypothetical protein
VRTSDGALVAVLVPKGAPALPGEWPRRAIESGWCFSLDGGESFRSDISGTISEAVEAARVELGLEVVSGERDPGTVTVHVGRAVLYDYRRDILTLGADSLFEALREQAAEQCGEWADDFLSATTSEKAIMGAMMADAFETWLLKYEHHRPRFFSVESSEAFTVDVHGQTAAGMSSA